MDAATAQRAIRAHLIDDLFFGDSGAALEPGDDLFELGLDSLGVTRLMVFLEREITLASWTALELQHLFTTPTQTPHLQP